MLNRFPIRVVQSANFVGKLVFTASLIVSCLLLNSHLHAANLPPQAYQRLNDIHKKVHLLHGDINAELPEQLLSANFLPSNAKVLELGADVGRNSCVIATILDDSSQMVSLETRPDAARFLEENRLHNGLKFHVKNAALSKVGLVQRGWVTIPSEVDLPGYTRVPTVTFDQLMAEFGIVFDTLVCDCEGALYWILKDEPRLLDNIHLILIENDFQCAEHQQFVANHFRQSGFSVLHNEGGPYWGEHSFYQVWAK